MSAFEYKALDARGRTRRGVLEGDTARQVRQQLRDQGLSPLEVKAAAERERRSTGGLFAGRGIGAADLALFTRQLATLAGAAVPLEEALATVARQSAKPRLRNLVMAVRGRVTEGHSLAESMRDYPRAFPELYRATVGAGEQSGHLGEVLDRLADYTEQRQRMRNKVQLALLYPGLLTLVAIAVVVGLVTYVVPQVAGVFSGAGRELPALTAGLIALSDLLRAQGHWIALGLAVAVAAGGRLLRLPKVRLGHHRLLLRLPLLSLFARGADTARFTRTLSILAGAGVPLLEALRIASQVMINGVMRAAVEGSATRVREGSSLHAALEESGVFPPMTVHLIASGESGGRLEEMLARAAEQQERELEGLIAVLLGLFEPLLILVMGGVVLLIVLAVLLPIFQLNQLVA